MMLFLIDGMPHLEPPPTPDAVPDQPLFVPIHATAFIINSVAMQLFTLWLHNGTRTRLPPLLRE